VHDCGNDGFTLASETGGLLENVRIYNNISYRNKFIGFKISINGLQVRHPMRNIKVINNTSCDNGQGGWGGGIAVDNPNARNVVIRNNICSQNRTFQIVVGEDVRADSVTIDHNLIDGFRGDPGEIYGSDSVTGSPKFVNLSGADFHLTEDSPATDKGSSLDAPKDDFDRIPRPQGAGYDIGCYEFRTSAVGIMGDTPAEPLSLNLMQNYPNPFNPVTTIRFSIAQRSYTTLEVFDVLGREVATLVNEWKESGSYKIAFDIRNSTFGILTSGMYFCRMSASGGPGQTGRFVEVKRMILLR
jgi:hypothetical protein